MSHPTSKAEPTCAKCGAADPSYQCWHCDRHECDDCSETHECPLPEHAIWQLTDDMSNGRWLFVDHPVDGDGIPVGIQRVYTKYLDSAEARAMAAALVQAADELDARPKPKPVKPVYTTSGTSVVRVGLTLPDAKALLGIQSAIWKTPPAE